MIEFRRMRHFARKFRCARGGPARRIVRRPLLPLVIAPYPDCARFAVAPAPLQTQAITAIFVSGTICKRY
jgi:hypothetical protein